LHTAWRIELRVEADDAGPEIRYFFDITNDRATAAADIVLQANDRCDQENLVAQLKDGVHALKTPVDNLVSNWADMVLASLSWSLNAWAALWVPVAPRHAEQHRAQERSWSRMEFAKFRAAVIEMPCQINRSGRWAFQPREGVGDGERSWGGDNWGQCLWIVKCS
jgi:hypothetical protein